MATVNKKNALRLQQYAGPDGNVWADRFTFTTNSSGIFVDSDKTTAVASGDVVRIGVLPAGLEIHTSLAIVSDAFTASTTADIGFAYVDGVDVTATPQDADYFNAALATSSTGRTAAANAAVAPVVLPKDAYLTLTIGGANHASVGVLDVIVTGICKGRP
jgi:hypothetical protein